MKASLKEPLRRHSVASDKESGEDEVTHLQDGELVSVKCAWSLIRNAVSEVHNVLRSSYIKIGFKGDDGRSILWRFASFIYNPRNCDHFAFHV